jgi:ParB family chromosome partitioning protein
LETAVIELVETGQLSQGHARALITLPKNEQVIIAKKAVVKRLSVREVEQAVKNYFHPKDDEKRRAQANMSVELKDLIVRLQRGLGTKVGAIGNDNKGRIYIDYYTRDDLDRISDILDKLENIK